MALGDEVVHAAGPEDEEEEEELVDPQETAKTICAANHCVKYQDALEECTNRVEGKSDSSETCTQELFDFLHCVDHCVSKELFKKLK